jgi:DNA-directed RNA polymerase specialized sigma subunit
MQTNCRKRYQVRVPESLQLQIKGIKQAHIINVSEYLRNSLYELSAFYINCFKRISKLTNKMQSNALVEYVIEWMKTRERKEITARELYLANKSRFKSTEDVKTVFAQMQELELGNFLENNRTSKFILIQP